MCLHKAWATAKATAEATHATSEWAARSSRSGQTLTSVHARPVWHVIGIRWSSHPHGMHARHRRVDHRVSIRLEPALEQGRVGSNLVGPSERVWEWVHWSAWLHQIATAEGMHWSTMCWRTWWCLWWDVANWRRLWPLLLFGSWLAGGASSTIVEFVENLSVQVFRICCDQDIDIVKI